jgi:uncharacterized membrane protein YhhN
MKTIFLVLFILDAISNIGFIFARWEWPRRVSKTLLMPLLLGYYFAGAEHFLFTVFLAGIFGWIGDIFLINTSKIKIFIAGLLSFLLGHLCYIRSLLYFIETFKPAALIAALIAAILLSFVVFRVIRPGKAVILPLVIYGGVLTGTAITAFCLMLSRGDLLGTVFFTGGVCFLVSDILLGYGRFKEGAHTNDAAVMITYIAAQSCLILGLAQV